jgi:hypothetical protein
MFSMLSSVSPGRCRASFPASRRPLARLKKYGWGRQWAQVKDIVRAAGRDADPLTGAMYLTLSIDDRRDRANERLNACLEQYYSQQAAVTRKRQTGYAGPSESVVE